MVIAIAIIGNALMLISGNVFVDEPFVFCVKYSTSWINVSPLSKMTSTLAEHIITERITIAIGSRRVRPEKNSRSYLRITCYER